MDRDGGTPGARRGADDTGAVAAWASLSRPWQVAFEEAELTDRLFIVRMVNDIEARRRFIQAHAKTVKNLDI